MKSGEARFWIVYPLSITEFWLTVLQGTKSFPQRVLYKEILFLIFFFFFVWRGLSASLRAKKKEGLIFGIKIKHLSSYISHILFADVCFILSKVITSEIDVIIGCLKKFKETSRQIINQEKSEVFFSSRTLDSLGRWSKMLLESINLNIWGTIWGFPPLLVRIR